jgi:alkanesulfonate monooxygenase SsuD/methylene tetrahydromethanopterin reductase-like flavin-dependent oxidoreductase (luciferase family)
MQMISHVHAKLDVGLLVDFRNPPGWRRPWTDHYARTLEFIEEADRLGSGAIFLTEHHLTEDGYLPQPMTMAGAIAVRTRRSRIGTAVMLATLRHPLHMAEEVTIVDLLSGGRAELGLGTGYRPVEFAAFGVDAKNKHAVLDSHLVELRRLLTPGSEMSPPPAQARLPLWVGYNGPAGARRAGLLGEGLLSVRRELLEPYRRGLVEGGHDAEMGRMCGHVNLVVTDDPEATWAAIERNVAYQMNSYIGYRAEGSAEPPPAPVTGRAIRQGTERIGEYVVLTPESAVDYLRGKTIGLPVAHVLTWLSIANMPDNLIARHLELLFTKVAPALMVTTTS